MIKGFNALDDGFTGKGINIAVLDTGFSSHPDISYAGGYSAIEDQSWSVDDDGHGTHVAGTIGARMGTLMQGVSPEANVYGVKVFGQYVGKEHTASVMPDGQFTLNMNRKLEAGEELVIFQEDGQIESDKITFLVQHNGGNDYSLLETSRTTSGKTGSVTDLHVINEGRDIRGVIDGEFAPFNTVVAQDNYSYHTAPLSAVLDGLDWAIQSNMDIVNMSIGLHEYSREFEALIDYALNKGMLVVASSGNEGDASGTRRAGPAGPSRRRGGSRRRRRAARPRRARASRQAGRQGGGLRCSRRCSAPGSGTGGLTRW